VRLRAAAAVVAVAAVLGDCGGEAVTIPAPAVVAVRVPVGAARPDEIATAFAIADRRALTVAHVLRQGRPVLVARRRARVVRVERRLDVAVVAVAGLTGPRPRAGTAEAGDRVSVLVVRGGAVRSLRARVRRAITARMTARSGSVRVRPALELAATVEPGDSGAPVVGADGRVVGVVFAQASDREGVTYAVDARALGTLLTR
jgi:S1-C subfamily serine protease